MNGISSTNKKVSNDRSGRLVKIAAMLLLPILVAGIAACDSNSSATPTAGISTLVPPSGTATASTTAVNSRSPYEGVPEGKPKYTTSNQPDIPEVLETKAAGELPSFALSMPGSARDKVISYYKGAAEHFADYSHIPCYCGCAMYEHPHSSLASCYVKEIKGDGSVVFTDHSTTCDKCQDIADMTVTGLAAGRPVGDIRADVFTKYKYTGTWTDTAP